MNCPGADDSMAQTRTIIPPTATHSFEAFVELRICLASDVTAVSAFIDDVMRFVARFRARDGGEVDIEIALREAILNAVLHGNREEPGARVFVAIRCSLDGEVLITMRDQGNGFDIRAVPDPIAPGNLMSTSGRGIYLMRACMDEVWFEEGGTVACMRKRSKKVRI